jgi:hypothetical protein
MMSPRANYNLQFRLKKVEHKNDSYSLLKSGLWTALQMPPSVGEENLPVNHNLGFPC